MAMSFVIVGWASTWKKSWFGLGLFYIINIFRCDFVFIVFIGDIFHEIYVLSLK
jgi:hypothetical protein